MDRRRTILLALVATVMFVAAALAGEARTGQEVYQSKCSLCHATGAAGAPKLGDAEAWGPHIKSGIHHLLENAKSGKGYMPPRGACTDCTDHELEGAIRFMMEHVK